VTAPKSTSVVRPNDFHTHAESKRRMGFMDQNAGGGGPPLMRWNGQEGKYLKYDSDLEFNDECFVLNPAGAVAGYLKFKGKGEPPERHTGPIYPKDEAPERASLGDTDQSQWAIGPFSNEPEDPWTPVIELPLKHKETGEEFVLSCQSKTAIGAGKDLFSQLRRVPSGHDPVIKLAVGTMQTQFGKRKKPVFSLVGQVPHADGKAPTANEVFGDDVGF
jgi:hypothetical protein